MYCSGSSEQNQFDFWTNSYRSNKQSKFINGFWSDKFDDVFEAINYLLKKDKVSKKQEERIKIGFTKED